MNSWSTALRGEHTNNYTTDAVGSRIQFNDVIRQDGTCPNFEVKSKTLYETPILTNIELYPYIATIPLTILTMPASSAAAEWSFSAIL
jgi:hypothetical protein